LPDTTKALPKWRYGLPLYNAIMYRVSIFILRVLGKTVWRWRLDGVEKCPTDEPFLLLPNHTSLLDPFWVGSPINRCMKSMASRSVLKIPYLGAYLKSVGSFAKMKYTKDRGAMQTLQRLFDEGFAILLFPEGNRSFSGETAPLLPGVGRLIKRLGCKVVYARLNTAYFYQPRWAKYPRWVPIEITYDGPYSYDDDQTPEQITAHAQQHLNVAPHLKAPASTWGFRMAHGLPQYLWACPKCFALEALEVAEDDGNAVVCSACNARWSLNVECQLTGPTTLSVADAFRAIEAHFGAPPVVDRAHFDDTQVALRAPGGKLLVIPQDHSERTLLAEGEYQIHATGLRIVDGETVLWEAPFESIKAISVEMANLLHFRIDGVLHRVVLPGESPLKWDHFLRKWRLHAVGAEH
jgi:1-acyl-sn-glycerol-3-phosphate acyltransferase